jgi:hypothetical protein
MEILIILFLIVVFVAGVALFLGYLIWRIGVIGRISVVIIGGLFILLVYSAFFPFDDFYKEEFVYVTGTPFPASGRIVKKYATYPDFHGDYMSCALIQVSEIDYQNLKSILQQRDAKPESGSPGICEANDAWNVMVSDYQLSIIQRQEGGESKEWGVLKDNRMVYISYFRY